MQASLHALEAQWCDKIAEALTLYGRAVSLVELGARCRRPSGLGGAKLKAVLRADARFVLIDDGLNVRLAERPRAAPAPAPAPAPAARGTPAYSPRAPASASASAAPPALHSTLNAITPLLEQLGLGAARAPVAAPGGDADDDDGRFAPPPPARVGGAPALSLLRDGAPLARGTAVLGRVVSPADAGAGEGARGGGADEGAVVCLNTREPFCAVAVGVQGSGKSHTMSVVLEACLVPAAGVADLAAPMCALVLHFDASASGTCEAVGLGLERAGGGPRVPPDAITVLVSPSYYEQRVRFYAGVARVRPLLLDWTALSADHIRRLMGIKEGDAQLYVATMLDMLRNYQRRGVLPDFAAFRDEVLAKCDVAGQAAPLRQRLALLSELVRQSPENAAIAAEGAGLADVARAGALVIVDLTNPLVSRAEANGVFQVLVEQFRALRLRGVGKLLALDEAHQFMDGGGDDGLSRSIVNAARLMRHEGLRLAVSTQSPASLAPELLELVSFAVLHKFFSPDWYAHLRAKLPLPPSEVADIAGLPCGTALVFAAAAPGGAPGGAPGAGTMRVAVRQRVTRDLGASVTHDA